MKPVRVLIMGHDKLADNIRRYLAQAGIELIDTSQDRDQVYDEINERYVMSAQLMHLVRDASPDLYDAIIICNTLGMGRNYAVVVPEQMRPVTMIAWNVFQDGNQVFYVRLGFANFGNCARLTDDFEELTVADFIICMAAQMA